MQFRCYVVTIRSCFHHNEHPAHVRQLELLIVCTLKLSEKAKLTQGDLISL